MAGEQSIANRAIRYFVGEAVRKCHPISNAGKPAVTLIVFRPEPIPTLVRQSGINRFPKLLDHIFPRLKFSWHIVVLLSLCLTHVKLSAADLQSGEVFADGQNVSGSRLNNSVNGATILPAFISNKTNTAMVDADSILFYQAGGDALLRSTLTLFKASVYASPSFTGTSTFSESTAFTGVISPTQLTASVNNYAPTNIATATTLRISADVGTWSITGIAGGTTGRMLIIHNVGSFDITFPDESGSSTSTNRFALTRDLTLCPDQVAVFHYDVTTGRWRTFGDRPTINPSFTTLTDAATTTLTGDPQKTSQNAKWTIGGNRVLVFSGVTAGMSGELRITQDGTGSRKVSLPGPSFTDGVGNGTTTFTSATANFATTDVGKPISESGSAHITMGVTIASRTNSTTVVLSATAASGTGITFYLPSRTSKVLGSGNGMVTLTTTAGALDVLGWSYDGTNYVWGIQKDAN